jgi:DNA-directed RNA polymerase specialized sigma24 family protein
VRRVPNITLLPRADLDDGQRSLDAELASPVPGRRQPSRPAALGEVAEEYERLMRQLGDAELVQLAMWKLEGFTNDEIAAKWGRALRTVERKLQLIRKIWSNELPASAGTAE